MQSLDDVVSALKSSIEAAVRDASVTVTVGSPGHFSLAVVSPAFDGLSMLQSQRLVYGAIAHLMKGDSAPVHAIDSLRTQVA